MALSHRILLLLTAIISIHAAVTVNPITGVSSQNLVFSGLIPITATNNLFFTYFGVDGQTDQNALKNFPLLIFVGKYLSLYLALAHPPNTTASVVSVPSTSTLT
jgi:hypothetical protein